MPENSKLPAVPMPGWFSGMDARQRKAVYIATITSSSVLAYKLWSGKDWSIFSIGIGFGVSYFLNRWVSEKFENGAGAFGPQGIEVAQRLGIR